MGVIEEEQLIRVLAEQLGVKVARIGERTVSAEIVDLVPGDVAEKHRCLPLFLSDGDGGEVLVLAMEDPADAEALADVRRHVRCELRPVLVAPSELEAAFERYHRAGAAAEDDSLGAAVGLMPPVPAAVAAAVPDAGPGAEVSVPRLPPTNLMDDGADPCWSEIGDDPGLGGLAGEDPLADFEKEPFADDVASSLQEEPTDPVAVTAGSGAPARPPRQEAMLQALAQLLVEKGIITREEFAARLRQLTRGSD
jgi:hypothetical protein